MKVALIESCSFETFVVVVVICVITRSLQDISVINHPQNDTVASGAHIILQCVFNESVTKCVWSRNAQVISIKERYKYYNSTVNGETTNDCSIEISGFDAIDVAYWQCACTASAESATETCKSDSAFLRLVNVNSTTRPSTTPTHAPPSNDTNSSFVEQLDITDLLLFVVIGLLLGTILLLTIVYCHRSNKAKRKRNSNPLVAMTEIPINLMHHNSTTNLNQSTESICTLCHQHKPEPCSPGGVWSAPYGEHPLPQVEEQLPSYDEANLQHEYNLYEQIPNRQSMGYYMSIDEIQKQSPSTSMTIVNGNGPDSTCNPLTMSSDNGSATCNPLYEKIVNEFANAYSDEPEVDVDANEIVRFDMGTNEAIYTRVHPNMKSGADW